MAQKHAIIPLGGRVLVEVSDEPSKTESGIIIPDTAQKEKPGQGVVVAVGEGERTEGGELIPVAVKKGDVVLFSKYSPDEVEIDGKEYLIVNAKDILAVVK